jgi:hypothetical protein
VNDSGLKWLKILKECGLMPALFSVTTSQAFPKHGYNPAWRTLPMKTLSILFLFVLLAACAPAVTEAPPLSTETLVLTNTPDPTATVIPSPTPTPTESPEQATARLAQDVLDGNITDLSDLDEQQRAMVMAVLVERIPELAALVIRDQSVYAELTAGWDVEMRRALALEIADQVNANKVFSHEHVDAYGVNMVLDANTNTWVAVATAPGYEGQYEIPDSNPVGEQPMQVLRPALSVIDPDTDETIGYEKYDYDTEEWVPFDYQVVLTGDMNDLIYAREVLTKIFGAEVVDRYLKRVTEKSTGMLVSGIVSGDFTESMPMPVSTSYLSKGVLIHENFRATEIEAPIFSDNGELLGLLVVHAATDYTLSGRVGIVNSDLQPTGKTIMLNPTGPLGQRIPPEWNSNTANSAVGKQIVIFLVDLHTLSDSSSNFKGAEEVFPGEILPAHLLPSICQQGEMGMSCDLQALQKNRSSVLAYGLRFIAQIGR